MCRLNVQIQGEVFDHNKTRRIRDNTRQEKPPLQKRGENSGNNKKLLYVWQDSHHDKFFAKGFGIVASRSFKEVSSEISWRSKIGCNDPY
jgi:hypothetical protein